MWHDFRGHLAILEFSPLARLSQYLYPYVLKPSFLNRHVIHVLKDVITECRRVCECS